MVKPTTYAIWVHGNTLQVDDPDQVLWRDGDNNQKTKRSGRYFKIEGKKGVDAWFHFSIPTPVIIPYRPPDRNYEQGGDRMRINRFLIKFQTGSNDVILKKVSAWDNDIFIKDYIVDKTGDYTKTSLSVPEDGRLKRLISSGIGFSVCVGFGSRHDKPQWIKFFSVGAEFRRVP